MVNEPLPEPVTPEELRVLERLAGEALKKFEMLGYENSAQDITNYVLALKTENSRLLQQQQKGTTP